MITLRVEVRNSCGGLVFSIARNCGYLKMIGLLIRHAPSEILAGHEVRLWGEKYVESEVPEGGCGQH